MLFGIPTRSPYGFLHDYSSMRIGALLENGDGSLDFVRRKGAKDTLLAVGGLPFPGGEAALRPFLAGNDRSFFERMFSLDHVRLEAGGKEILEAEDEIGQMLFAAGTGVAGLRQRLEGMNQEADGLWAARRAQRRKYYLAHDKLKEAEKDLREQTLTARKWQELKRDVEAAKRAHAEVDAEFEELFTKRKRLGRIRRVYRHVRRKAELEQALAELGSVVPLPEDGASSFAASEREESKASARMDTLNTQLAQAQEEQEGLAYDERLVTRADDIDRLHERRIEVQGMRRDLPLRQTELETKLKRLRDLAIELDWREDDAGALIARIPNRANVATVRALLNGHGALASEVRNGTKSLQQAQADLADLQERLEGMEDPVDVASLGSLVKALRQGGDIGERIRGAEQRCKEARQRVDRSLSLLHPGVESAEAATQLPIPAHATVENHRAKVQDCELRTRDLKTQLDRAEQEIERTRESRDRLAGDQSAITIEALQQARNDRDTLWRLVKKKHIDQATISSEEAGRYASAIDDLGSAFESAVTIADERADRRFANAEKAARLTDIVSKIREQESDLKRLRKQRDALALGAEHLHAEWEQMWQPSGIRPRDPEAMLEWIGTRGELLDAMAYLEERVSVLESEKTAERDTKGRLLEQLASIGADGANVDDQSLAVVLERADDVVGQHQQQERERSQVWVDRRQVEAKIVRQCRELNDAKEAWRQWRQDWSASLKALGLDTETSLNAVGVQLELIDQMREVAGSIDNLRHERIGKIKGAIDAFEQDVGETIAELADDLAGATPDDAVLKLEKRLKDAQSIQRRKADKARDIERIETDLRKQQDKKEEARQSVASLREAAGVDTNGELKVAIEKSDRKRELESDWKKTLRELEREGDGLPISELEAECQSVDPDEVAAQEGSLEADLKAAQDRLTEAVQAKSHAEQATRAVDGDAAAARAEAKRQEALADIRDVAERYARVRSSAMLLRWAIDRYRREKQAPLLKRASDLFAKVTSGSFESLRVEYDSSDRASLRGLRPNGEVVSVSGMSSGTADQLYFVLRVAAIEDYLDRSAALPFVADDLFINFDDRRATAGFRILSELARKTQVLFFTHHAHLLRIAREALDESLSIVDISTVTGLPLRVM